MEPKQPAGCPRMHRLFLCITLYISLFSAAQNINYKVGDKLDVKWSGNWYTAQIIDIKDGWYWIKYDVDGIVHQVKSDRMRPLQGYTYSTGTAAGTTAPTPPAGSFTIGSVVEARTTSKWYKGKIVAIDGGKYKIHFDGYTDYYDEWVTVEQMRKPTGGNDVATVLGERPKAVVGANGLPLLGGTSWETLAIGNRGNETVPQAPAYFNFCKSGKWSVNRYGNFGEIGSYKVAGNQVLITNNTDNKTTTYTMLWNAAKEELTLLNDNFNIKFGLGSKNACGEGF